MFTVQKFVVIGVLALLIIGVWYAVLREPDAGQDVVSSDSGVAMEDISDEYSEAGELAGTASLKTLLARGQDMHCTYSFTDEGATGAGEGYFSDDRMRIEATYTTVEGVTYLTNMIDDGDMLYTWTSSPEGDFAMKFASPDDEGAVASTESEGITMDQEVTYDCALWTADAASFVPPSDIEFMDLDAMMNLSL